MKLNKFSLVMLAVCPLLLFGGCSKDNIVHTTDNVLIIGLATGFVGDSISVTVNGKIVLIESVSTDMTIDMAKVFEATAPHGINNFSITVVDKNISADTTVLIGGNTFLQVMLKRSSISTPERFEIIVSDQSPWKWND